ncbi:MAG: hypothetical protein IPP94_17020 [Ignavibacteria bacterium]|nr:hypothetical protein [Ignavibacteria bacterium]
MIVDVQATNRCEQFERTAGHCRFLTFGRDQDTFSFQSAHILSILVSVSQDRFHFLEGILEREREVPQPSAMAASIGGKQFVFRREERRA